MLRPYPRGWVASGGRCACRNPTSSNTWLVQSAKEWIASASSAPDPVKNAATPFATAMATLTSSDWTTCEAELADTPRTYPETDLAGSSVRAAGRARALEVGAIPVGQVGGGGVGALQESEDLGAGIGRAADGGVRED